MHGLISSLWILLLTMHSDAFVVNRLNMQRQSFLAASPKVSILPPLFDDDQDMIPVAENYIRAKYRQIVGSNGHDVADTNDLKSVLHQILPPVTPEELEREEQELLRLMLCKKDVCEDELAVDDFVKAIIKNSYWRAAGDIVVKELMYFDSVSNRSCFDSFASLILQRIPNSFHDANFSFMHTIPPVKLFSAILTTTNFMIILHGKDLAWPL